MLLCILVSQGNDNYFKYVNTINVIILVLFGVVETTVCYTEIYIEKVLSLILFIHILQSS